jgi:hypothetical protein
MSKTYEQFLDYVMPHVPGCTPEMAIQAIRNTVIEFCERTLILQRDHDPVTVTANVQDYDFEPPSGYLVQKVMKAWYKNNELVPFTPDQISDVYAYRNSVAGEAANKTDPLRIFQKDERTFSLHPWPVETVTDALTMRVALKPTRASTKIEDVIFEDWLDAIAAGALVRLQMSPAKPYTLPNAAAINQQIYMQKTNEARQKAIRGHVRGNQQIKIRRI